MRRLKGEEVVTAASVIAIRDIQVLVLYLLIGMPDGGSGGNGGDVYFKASRMLGSLYELRKAHFFGNSGKSGKVSIDAFYL